MRQAADRYALDLTIDSAGTGDWHIGHPPDRRAQAVARSHGNIDISGYRGRQISNRDFLEYDLICALDHSNLKDLQAMGGDGPAEISLLLDYLPGSEGQAVADPYYGEDGDFADCWQQVSAATDALARHLSKES